MTDIVERLRLCDDQMVALDHLNRPYGLAKSLEHEAADEIERLRDALNKIGGITMSMCLNYKDMAETQRGIAIAALKETECE
jgi:hypothetical protein